MNILYLLVPAAVMLAAIGVAAFSWAVRTGQFDDVDTPPLRALFDDEPAEGRPDDRSDPTASQPHG